MGAAPLTFVHLTDLHVNAPGVEDETVVGDTRETLRRTLSEVRRMSAPPAFIVISGDLTNHGDEAAYRTVAGIFADSGLDLPVIMALGNHDSRTGFAAAFPELHHDPAKPYDHDRLIAGLHVIALDSSLPGEIGGGWEPGQMDWLKSRLVAHPGTPKLLVSHHGPMLDETAPELAWESLSVAATGELRAAIAGAPVVGVLSGHVHLDRVAHWHGVPVVIGAGGHAGTDPVALPSEMRMLDATGFAICTLRPSGLTVTFAPHPQTRKLKRKVDIPALLAYLAERKATGG